MRSKERTNCLQISVVQFPNSVALKTWVKFTQYFSPFTCQHQYAYCPHCFLYTSHGADIETLLNNQELL